MEYNDYYVIALRILRQVYNAVKQGETVDVDQISPQKYEINEKYWNTIIQIMVEDGLLKDRAKGMNFTMIEANPSWLKITAKGIALLFGPDALRQAMVTARELDAGLAD